MSITNLYPLITPLLHVLGSVGGVAGIWIVTSRLRRRDALEAAMFQHAFNETKDPCVLGYYAQMRGRRGFTLPRRHGTKSGLPPPGAS